MLDANRPPNTIGQNAAAYGRTKAPRSPRARAIRLLVALVVVAAIALGYALTR